jgi:leader peptidase (prepilin peptidase)/N-methyltransferase
MRPRVPGNPSHATRASKKVTLAPADKDAGLGTLSVRTRFTLAIAVAGCVVVSIGIAPGPNGVLGAGLALIMVAIAVIDYRSFIIPNWLNAAGLGLGLVHAAVQEPEAMLSVIQVAVIRGVVLAVVFLTLREVYARVRNRQGIGLGDVKLAGVAGVWLDWSMLPIVVELAAFTAISSYALQQYLLGRSMVALDRLPFGFFFAPAIWICWLLERTLMVTL